MLWFRCHQSRRRSPAAGRPPDDPAFRPPSRLFGVRDPSFVVLVHVSEPTAGFSWPCDSLMTLACSTIGKKSPIPPHSFAGHRLLRVGYCGPLTVSCGSLGRQEVYHPVAFQSSCPTSGARRLHTLPWSIRIDMNHHVFGKPLFGAVIASGGGGNTTSRPAFKRFWCLFRFVERTKTAPGRRSRRSRQSSPSAGPTRHLRPGRPGQ